MVMGTREQATALLGQLSERVQALGLKLKAEKTAVTHIDEGFVFLGQTIIGRTKHGKHHVYTFVTNEALASIKRKVKALTGRSTTNLALSELIAALNPVLRGWVNYYRHAAAKRTFAYLDYYVWWRVGRWLRKKHPRMSWKQIKRRYINDDYTYQDGGLTLYKPARTRVTRYRHRGAKIPTPWRQPLRPARKQNERASRNNCHSNASNRRSHDQNPTPCAHGEPDAATSRKSGSAGGGDETTGRRPTRRLAADPTLRPQASRDPRSCSLGHALLPAFVAASVRRQSPSPDLLPPTLLFLPRRTARGSGALAIVRGPGHGVLARRTAVDVGHPSAVPEKARATRRQKIPLATVDRDAVCRSPRKLAGTVVAIEEDADGVAFPNATEVRKSNRHTRGASGLY